MVKVLYIQSAPLSTSKSYIVAQEFIKSYKAANPDHQVVTWDLFAENGGEAGVKVPLFLQLEVEAKFGSFTGNLDPTQQKAWDEVLVAINFFKSFDRYIFSVPMWNFGIPHILKVRRKIRYWFRSNSSPAIPTTRTLSMFLYNQLILFQEVKEVILVWLLANQPF